MRARAVPEEEAVYFLVLPGYRNRVKPPLLPTYFWEPLNSYCTDEYPETPVLLALPELGIGNYKCVRIIQ
ncbi:hypothetical protein SUGI_0851940 [Cryptomeria japonica]|nr:hypothetical protein SUGI_0851940 [Cryptomeria japonica]